MSDFKPGRPVIDGQGHIGNVFGLPHPQGFRVMGADGIARFIYIEDFLRPATPEEAAAAGLWVDPRLPALVEVYQAARTAMSINPDHPAAEHTQWLLRALFKAREVMGE